MADVTKEIVLEVGLKDSTAAGTTSAKTRLRELQKALVEMSLAGQDGTKAFREMEAEAGKLKDQIGDTQQRIKQLASDTRTIDTFVGAIQGITAGFQIAQGAAALNAEFASVSPKEIYAAWAFVDEWLRHFGGGSLLELGKARILELQQSRPSSSKQTKRFMQMLAAGFDIKTKAIGASNLISKNH